MLDRIFTGAAPLEGALNVSTVRQRAVANNIANVNTPGFKRSDVSFDGYLSEAQSGMQMITNNPSHLQGANSSSGGELVTDNKSSMRLDGNNVDVDVEMAYLGETELRYNALTEFSSRYFRGLLSVINGGK